MYPHAELIRLAAHKVALQHNIAFRRAQCRYAAAHVLRPVASVDRMLAGWRGLAPWLQLAAVPLGFVLGRTVFRRWKILGSLVRFGPIALNLMRGVAGRSSRPRDGTSLMPPANAL